MRRLILTAALVCSTAVAQGPRGADFASSKYDKAPGAARLLEGGASALAGATLVSELRCAACHELPQPLAQLIGNQPRRDIPLAGRGSISLGAANHLIENHAFEVGASLPADRKESRHAILDLSQYLLSLDSTTAPPSMIEGDAERGDNLYHSVGCAACHEPFRKPNPAFTDEDDPFSDDTQIEYPPLSVKSVPMDRIGRTWTEAGLAAYLKTGRGRMPDMKLTDQEAADIAAYLVADDGDEYLENYEPTRNGAELYVQFGCVQCHEGSADPSPPTQIQFESLGGCIAPEPHHKGARYKLNTAQKEAIHSAWTATTFDTQVDSILYLAAKNNCLACHKRGEFGGVDPGRAPYFTTAIDADLGDEGSIPPTLTGVGSKLTLQALEAVLAGEGDARPYMATRMPNFHFENADEIAGMLAELDADPNEPATDVTGLLHHHRNHYGREMMGDQAFNCVSCHDLNGDPSTGIPAIDLALAPTRLRPEWFKKYLLDPAALRPGTRMPAYFPEGKSTYAKLFKGNASQQIEALWIYLREVDQTRLPSGMEKDDRYVIVPADRPVVHRTFMKDVGTRAIAVGFPQGVHYAFDATRVRSVMVWRGGFLDADATWNDRFSPYIEPLSDDRWDFLPIAPFAHGEFQDPWPEVQGKEADYHFSGIRTNGKEAPTILYRFGDIAIEETVEPFDKDNGFKRSFVMTNVTKPIRYVVAVGAHVDEEGDGYRVNSDWETKLEISNAELRQVMAPNGFAALVALITPVDGRIEFSQEVIW